MTYTNKDLLYLYNWTPYSPGDPRQSGYMDHTPFNRREGFEVLYMINGLLDEMGYDRMVQGNIIEEMLQHELPRNLSTQFEVKAWCIARLKRLERVNPVLSSSLPVSL